jgi:hypothetical protein
MTRSKSGKARWRALVLAFAVPLGTGVSVIGGGHVLAQSQKPMPMIDAPSIFEFETAKISPMPIAIKPEKDMPLRAMLLIRGLPGTVALTEGRLFASGVWSVKPSDLPNLKLVSPATIETSNIVISLVTLEGSVLAEKSAILSIATPRPKEAFSVTRAPIATPPAPPQYIEPEPKPAATQRVNSGAEAVAAIPTNTPPAPAMPALVRQAKTLSFEETEKVQVFMSKGEENMRSGNINLARLFYKRSADAGWAPGALALAQTYDAEELARMEVVGGIQPDAALARKWYEVARDLGSATAQQKLQRLGQR